MVNSKNVAVGMVVLVAMGTIVAYMKANGLTSSDITLSDACWRSNADPAFGAGTMNETCSMIDDEKVEWDTKIPCLAGFKPDTYFFTHRQWLGVESLGRGTKGADTVKAVEQSQTQGELEGGDAIDCDGLFADEEYSTFQADPTAWAAANKIDRKAWVIFGFWVPSTNYKACSLNLIFLLGGSDSAQCGGNGGWCSGGWTSKHHKSKYKLNRGCLRHDRCLEGGDTIDTANGYCCDAKLRAAANGCRWWGGGGLSCSWRGCSWGCSDSRLVGLLTYWGMPSGGHDGDCNTNGGAHYWP